MHISEIVVICDRCNARVKQWRVEPHPFDGSVGLTVFCHGERERMVIPRHLIEQNGKALFDAMKSGGRAFTPKPALFSAEQTEN